MTPATLERIVLTLFIAPSRFLRPGVFRPMGLCLAVFPCKGIIEGIPRMGLGGRNASAGCWVIINRQFEPIERIQH